MSTFSLNSTPMYFHSLTITVLPSRTSTMSVSFLDCSFFVNGLFRITTRIFGSSYILFVWKILVKIHKKDRINWWRDQQHLSSFFFFPFTGASKRIEGGVGTTICSGWTIFAGLFNSSGWILYPSSMSRLYSSSMPSPVLTLPLKYIRLCCWQRTSILFWKPSWISLSSKSVLLPNNSRGICYPTQLFSSDSQ